MSKNQIYWIVGGGCFIALCAIAALLFGVLVLVPAFSKQVVVPQATTVNANPQSNVDGNSMGDKNAPIQIVEFGDFQCPYCKRFHEETEPSLITNFVDTGKVYFTYRSAGNWVSKNIGGGNTESQDAAAAAYCAGDQGKFWQMHDALFANNGDVENQGSFSPERLTSIANGVGLDVKTYQDCFDGGKYADRVQKDYQAAVDAGVHGTPSFVVTYQVNNVTRIFLIEGAQPYEAFQQALNQILQEMGK